MIKVENLSKSFGPKLAVNDVSFHRGTGRSAWIPRPQRRRQIHHHAHDHRLHSPHPSGKVTVGGFDMADDPIPAKRLIGYLPENAPAYTDMTVEGFLDFCAELRGLRGDARKKAVHRVVEMCFLESVRLPKRGHAFQRLPPPHLLRPIHHPRPRRSWCWTNRPTAWTRTKSTKSAASSAAWASARPLFFPPISWRKSRRSVPAPSSLTAARSSPTARRSELKAKSDMAGAVLLIARGVAGAASGRTPLRRCPARRKTAIVKEEKGKVWARVYPKSGQPQRRTGPPGPRRRRPAGKSRNCTPRKAAWTKSSAASPCRTPAKEVRTNEFLLGNIKTIAKRELSGVFLLARRLCLHRHLSFVDGIFHLHGRADFSSAARPAWTAPFLCGIPWLYLFLVPGRGHAALGRGAPRRHA